MTSEDVIHSFYVPAFRVKTDVLPGKYTTAWFQATKPGEYHLFCAEYCGTSHALMGGKVVVLEPAAYERWLAGAVPGDALVAAGENLFTRLGCIGCHHADGGGRGPSLVGIFGAAVRLASGQTVTADETYLRESILIPQARLVAGYPPIMPTFKGIITEDGLAQILAYLKALRVEPRTRARP
jgi:cytochrome c oxidase subunit 2